jgi:hypothetical protein
MLPSLGHLANHGKEGCQVKQPVLGKLKTGTGGVWSIVELLAGLLLQGLLSPDLLLSEAGSPPQVCDPHLSVALHFVEK